MREKIGTFLVASKEEDMEVKNVNFKYTPVYYGKIAEKDYNIKRRMMCNVILRSVYEIVAVEKQISTTCSE
jgi:hypothetical protein